MLSIGLMGFFVAVVIGFLVIRFDHLHAHFSSDHTSSGPHKFHDHPVPRIGGVPIFIALIAAIALGYWLGKTELKESGLLLLCALPAFAGGLSEDVTKRVGSMIRLLATFLAAGMGFFLLDGRLLRLDVPGLDSLLAFWPISLLLTLVMVGGISHAINIVDGYNGLAGVVSLMIFAALGYVCFQVGDIFLLTICVAASGAVIGFLVWNFPKGLIFSGDGGAYLLGFLIGEVSVLLIMRNPEVSPWFPLLVCAYPVWETLFSIYRKKFIRSKSPGLPDGLHLHMLVYKRLVRWMIGSLDTKHRVQRNSATAPYLWGMASLTIIPSVMFWQNTPLLVGSFFLFISFYVWIYWRIVRFRSPRWMVLRKA